MPDNELSNPEIEDSSFSLYCLAFPTPKIGFVSSYSFLGLIISDSESSLGFSSFLDLPNTDDFIFSIFVGTSGSSVYGSKGAWLESLIYDSSSRGSISIKDIGNSTGSMSIRYNG